MSAPNCETCQGSGRLGVRLSRDAVACSAPEKDDDSLPDKRAAAGLQRSWWEVQPASFGNNPRPLKCCFR
jgi:hypothetical protein